MLGERAMARIRAARPGDAEAIAGIEVETWRAAYAGLIPDRVLITMSRRKHAQLWSRRIGRHGGSETVLVAEGAEAGVVGFGSCGRARSTGLSYQGEVYTLYVHHDHQGQGIGKELLGALFRRLLDGGMRSALAWVLAQNPARFFYEAMGGRRIAERDEKLWGVMVAECAYGWPDLEQALALAPGDRTGRSRRAEPRRRPRRPSPPRRA